MPRAQKISATFDNKPGITLVRQGSIGSAFSTILTDTTVVDAATITNPESQITAASRASIDRLGLGTSMQLLLRYPRAITSCTQHLKVKAAGRSLQGGTGAWQRLINAQGDSSVMITLDPTNDFDDGSTWKYALVREEHWFDCQAYDEFVVGVEQAATVAGGTMATAEIQARFV